MTSGLEKTAPFRTDDALLSFRIEGMDCPSCAAKIETVLAKLDGVGAVQTSFTAQTLKLHAASSPDLGQRLDAAVRPLGYRLVPLSAPAGDAPRLPPAPDTPPAIPWRGFDTPKSRQVLITGGLLATALIVNIALPALGSWPFTLAALIAALPIARKAFGAARAGMPFSIEMLMSIATLGAIVIGAAEEAAVVVALFALGEWLEGFAAQRARAGIAGLAALVPKTARRENADGTIAEVPATALQVGDIALVRPGDRIPADGEIVEGRAALDESPVTGESVPKTKAPGEPVFAGSISVDGALRLRVDKAAQDNTIARIVRLVEEAQEAKAPTERFIDRFSARYTPLVMGLALLVALLPPLIVAGDWQTWIYRALALLLIACPCALVISTPASIASALAAGARRGLLMKGGQVIETASRLRAIAFDKTGTLTKGQPSLTDLVAAAPTSEDDLLRLGAALETGSSHPLAQAVVAAAAQRNLLLLKASNLQVQAGRGLTGEVKGRKLFLGTLRGQAGLILAAELKRRVDDFEAEGKTVAALSDGDQILGLFAFRDEPRVDARDGIAALRALGIQTVMLTGDNRQTAAAIGAQLAMTVQAELLPEDKLRQIEQLKAQGPVGKVGDGINDAPALAAADLGIAMGSGTDIALEAADAALLRGRILDVAQLIQLSRTTMRVIRQNIVVALGLKAAFLITTIAGLTGLWPAILADTGATVLVTLNALRLLRAGHIGKPN